MPDRKAYWKRRYEAKREAGVCARGTCKELAVPGQTLCEIHRVQNLDAVLAAQRRDMLESRTREKLPVDRAGVTVRFTILATTKIDEKTGVGQVEEVKGYFQTGEYADGRLGEIFIKIGKPGEETALFDQWATLASIALQYGAGVEEIFSKALTTRFQPAGPVSGVKYVDKCTSVIDMIAQWVIPRYAGIPRRPAP